MPTTLSANTSHEKLSSKPGEPDPFTAFMDVQDPERFQVNSNLQQHYNRLKEELLRDIRRHIDTLDVTYEFTKHPFYLRQYYAIREECYKLSMGLEDFSGEEDFFDRNAEILVVRHGEKVIGGGRINGVSNKKPSCLVLEDDNFIMPELFPTLDLMNAGYCEFSRLVLLPEYRIGNYLEKMIELLSVKAIQLGYHYLFTVSPYVQARVYRKFHQRMGFDYKILNKIQVPEKNIYEGVKMCLSVSHLVQNLEPEYPIDTRVLESST